VRILIATVHVPFVRGGAEVLADGLLAALRRHGHEAEIVAVPFKWYPPARIAEHLLANRLLDLTESCGKAVDLLIGLKFPAYCIPHPWRVPWVLHQHRTAYDLWDTELGDLHRVPEGPAVREAIRRADNLALGGCPRVYAISRNVADRLKRYNGVAAEPLYPPCIDAEGFGCEDYGDFVLFSSRIGTIKRQYLAVEAMRHVRSGLRLVVMGRPDEPEAMERLKRIVAAHGLENRVTFTGPADEPAKRAALARCRGVVFCPVDEDYGYVTLEGFYSSKPVVTCRDSGGALEFVEDGRTGLVADPTPESLGAAIDRLGGPPDEAKRLGRNARDKILGMDITWDRVVRELTRA
jgi:glycosyltransferase involved in cell wall biosynthesis